jgi:hypothetical protein
MKTLKNKEIVDRILAYHAMLIHYEGCAEGGVPADTGWLFLFVKRNTRCYHSYIQLILRRRTNEYEHRI